MAAATGALPFWGWLNRRFPQRDGVGSGKRWIEVGPGRGAGGEERPGPWGGAEHADFPAERDNFIGETPELLVACVSHST
jgi:hypothetical protein